MNQPWDGDRISEVMRNWLDEDILEIVPIEIGSSCKTFQVTCSCGKYILRGQPSAQVCIHEAAVSNALCNLGISPRMIPAGAGEFCVAFDGLFFNLQDFLNGSRPDLSQDNQIKAAAMAAGKLHKALHSSALERNAAKHDATVSMLERVHDVSALRSFFPSSIANIEDAKSWISYLENRLCADQLIHGDLGSWNLLWDSPNMYIIDFGESYVGDFHFDLASVLCSVLAKCQNEEIFGIKREVFLDAYHTVGCNVDIGKLRICLYLWLLRGAIASVLYLNPAQGSARAAYFERELTKIRPFLSEAAK